MKLCVYGRLWLVFMISIDVGTNKKMCNNNHSNVSNIVSKNFKTTIITILLNI